MTANCSKIPGGTAAAVREPGGFHTRVGALGFFSGFVIVQRTTQETNITPTATRGYGGLRWESQTGSGGVKQTGPGTRKESGEGRNRHGGAPTPVQVFTRVVSYRRHYKGCGSNESLCHIVEGLTRRCGT